MSGNCLIAFIVARVTHVSCEATVPDPVRSRVFVYLLMALILARVIGGVSLKQTIRCAIPKLQYDHILKMHFRENTELLAHDPEERSKPGDWVLIRELPEPLSLKVRHTFVKHIYTQGDMRCPLTGKKTVGFRFAEDLDQDAAMFGWKPLPERPEPVQPEEPAAKTGVKSVKK